MRADGTTPDFDKMSDPASQLMYQLQMSRRNRGDMISQVDKWHREWSAEGFRQLQARPPPRGW